MHITPRLAGVPGSARPRRALARTLVSPTQFCLAGLNGDMAAPTVRDMKRGSLTRTRTVYIRPGRGPGRGYAGAGQGAGGGEHCLHFAGPWR